MKRKTKVSRKIAQVRGSDLLLRFAQVRHLVPLSRTTLWRKVREHTFPAPLELSHHARAWRLSDIREWVASRESKHAEGQQPAGQDR